MSLLKKLYDYLIEGSNDILNKQDNLKEHTDCLISNPLAINNIDSSYKKIIEYLKSFKLPDNIINALKSVVHNNWDDEEINLYIVMPKNYTCRIWKICERTHQYTCVLVPVTELFPVFDDIYNDEVINPFITFPDYEDIYAYRHTRKVWNKKRDIKLRYKKEHRKRFIIGQNYIIKSGYKNNIVRMYELKKFVYSLNDIEMKVLIMKQISGPDKAVKHTLTKEDCKLYHLKFEPGLEMFSMNLPFKLVKTNV